MLEKLLMMLENMYKQTLIPMIIAAILSISFMLLFIYENRKRQRNKKENRKVYNEIFNLYEHLDEEYKKLDTKEKIQSQIINCANKALKDGDTFQKSMKELANTLRTIFQSEYCAIGKIVKDIVEDYASDYDEYDDEELQNKQQNSSHKARKVNINNSEYMVCEALKCKEFPISYYGEEEINKKQNEHYNLYKNTILKSGNLTNTTIIPLRDSDSENYGYIQFINSKNNLTIDDINPFRDGLLQLVQMIIKKEEDKLKLDENNKFIDDSNFIKKIIQQKYNIDTLLDNIMEYLSKEFNVAVISFRIPVLNGYKREPLFYLRMCYVNPAIENSEKIKEFYYKKRVIKNQNELGGYNKLKCCNDGEIILENSIDSDYYSEFNLDLKEQTLMMPVLKDIGKDECIRIEHNPICMYHENQECVERFRKLYGLFKLRMFKNDNNTQDSEVVQKEEEYFIEEAKKRLSYLSGQITLILNSIVDKCENDSLKIFRENLKGQQFLKIRDFDKQFIEIIKKSTHAKECSIYRYSNTENEKLFLSATTSKKILYKGNIYSTDEIIQKLNYSILDEKSIIVRVFKEKQSKYLYNLHDEVHIGDFIEMPEDIKVTFADESFFLIPIIKKDEEKTCLGVVVLIGKQKNEYSISTAYWEQDKGLIEFIVEMFTRISEADSERLTFLSQLRHELLSPITELVQENDYLFNKYNIRKEPFEKTVVLKQLQNNIDNCFFFQYIISDIEHIYSSSMKDIDYNIEIQQEPGKILQEVISLFRSSVPIITSISQMPPIYMDKYRIKQVFFNILKNAIRYSYQGQQIEIYYKQIEENGFIQHEIKFVNYGIGILEEDKDRIFDLYKRGKNVTEKRASGSGMGLYIVREIMKAHGGECIIRKLKDPTEISLIFPNKQTNK